jgi:dihydropteroate synthase
VQAGAHILRVHDVAAVRRAVRVAEAIRDAPEA